MPTGPTGPTVPTGTNGRRQGFVTGSGPGRPSVGGMDTAPAAASGADRPNGAAGTRTPSLPRVPGAARLLHPAGQPFPPGAHDTRSAALVGRLLGIAVLVAFVTGLISHLHQNPVSWFDLPSRPVQAYRFTQGLHVVTGIACIPLLLAKLWVIYRRLFTWPPVTGVTHALERLLVMPLVAGMLFEVTSGVLNVVGWYPWPFFFPRVHYAVAWMVIGALLAHVAFKAHHLVGDGRYAELYDGPHDGPHDGADDTPADERAADADRRALLLGSAGAVLALGLTTAGETVPGLRPLSVLLPRDVTDGPQGLTVNRTAAQARVMAAATDPGWRLTVADPRPVSFSLAELEGMAQRTVRLPIACVEGWSFMADWTGVPVRDLLEAAGVPDDVHLQAVSLEQDWIYTTSPLNPGQAWDPLTTVALQVNGERLALDHGFPARLIAPNRPGVQQTKWLSRIEPA